MNWRNYLDYFWFIAWNWNLPLAIFLIRNEINGEKKYDSSTLSIDNLEKEIDPDILPDTSIYQPVSFYAAERLLAFIDHPEKSTGFLDVGCGRGRALQMAAYFGFRKLFGLDIVPYLLEDSKYAAGKISNKYPDVEVTLIHGNAALYKVPHSIDTIFLFNPFKGLLMNSFILRVKESLIEKPRKMTLLYANPVCKEIWMNAGFEEIMHFKKMKYIEGAVLVYDPEK